MIEAEVIFYFYHINDIGGVETMFWQMARMFEDKDIMVVYKTGNIDQINRIKKHIRVVRYKKGMKFKCKKAYYNYMTDILEHIEAEEHNQLIHADYRYGLLGKETDARINRFIAVSETAKEGFEEVTGKKAEVIYNPIVVEDAKRPLILVSATRLSKEKGKDRMIKLGEALNNAGIPYIWLVFTNDIGGWNNPNVVYMKPQLNIYPYMKMADYVVQLSDTEAYAYTIVESLMLSKPLIISNLPVLDEIGINKDNSIVLDFDMNNLDVNEIYNKKFNFKYTPRKSEWENELKDIGKSKYKEELKMRFKVEALKTYKEKNLEDSKLKRIPEVGEQFEVSKERLDILLGENKYKVAFVKLVEEVKEETKGSVIEQPYEPLPQNDKPLAEIIEDIKEVTKKKTTKKKATKK